MLPLLQTGVPLAAQALLEAFLFAYGNPLEIKQLAACINKSEGITLQLLEYMAEGYRKNSDSGLMLLQQNDKWQLVTKPEFAATLAVVLPRQEAYRITPAMLETLAIIACRQPVSRQDLEMLRGVNCDNILSKLLGLELVEECGKRGRLTLYGTTERFLSHFGLAKPQDLLHLLPEEKTEE